MARLTKDEYYLRIAQAVSERSTCLRRRYGAVIVKNDEIIATGYNGSPRGSTNCCDIGYCYRELNKIPHGEQYEKCVSVHAEMNAIISAKRTDIMGAKLYLYCFDTVLNMELINPIPCEMCKRLISNSGISAIVTKQSNSRGAFLYANDV